MSLAHSSPTVILINLIHPQENIIREFNLNELFQKSKKLNKSLGLKGEEQNNSQPEEGSDELQVDTPEEPTESKKDKWGGRTREGLHEVSSSNNNMPCFIALVQNITKRREKVQPQLHVIATLNPYWGKDIARHICSTLPVWLGTMCMIQCGLNWVNDLTLFSYRP